MLSVPAVKSGTLDESLTVGSSGTLTNFPAWYQLKYLKQLNLQVLSRVLLGYFQVLSGTLAGTTLVSFEIRFE